MKTLTLSLLATMMLLQGHATSLNKFRFTLVVQQTISETTVDLLQQQDNDLAMVKVNNFTVPLKYELYSLGEKIVASGEILNKDELTTLNLDNIDEYYTLRVHSEDGRINFVFRIFKEMEL